MAPCGELKKLSQAFTLRHLREQDGWSAALLEPFGDTLAKVLVLAASAQTGRSEPEIWPRYGLPVFVSGYEGYRLHKLD